MSELPPGITIAPPPPELQLDEADDYHRFDWPGRYGQRSALSGVQAAKAFPEPVEVGAPEPLRTAKMFACSGSPDSSRYREATKFRAMRDMGWEEARIALNRLVEPVRWNPTEKTSQYVALAEFALTAIGFTGFVGRRGEHAVKLRDALGDAGNILHVRLSTMLQEAGAPSSNLGTPTNFLKGLRGNSDKFETRGA